MCLQIRFFVCVRACAFVHVSVCMCMHVVCLFVVCAAVHVHLCVCLFVCLLMCACVCGVGYARTYSVPEVVVSTLMQICMHIQFLA